MLKQHRIKDDYTDETGTDYAAMWDDLKPDRPITAEPSAAQLESWMDDGGCEAVGCGCWVEPDGVCECGNESWLLHLGLI